MRPSLQLLTLAVLTPAFAGDKPLADAAKPLAASLKAGCIVTGERVGDNRHFALSGSVPPLKGIAPEKVVFEIGSITKVFTGLLLGQAVAEGKVRLDTPIRELLGAAQSFSDPRIGAITLEQLATHTSGLPRLPANLAAGSIDGDPYARYDEKLLRSFLTTAHLKGEPPFPCSYSNLGFGLLGHLLGKAYGLSWKKAVVSKICMPLGLTDTQPDEAGLASAALAPPFSGADQVKPWTFDAVAGAGALRSTAFDLIRFGEAIAAPENTPLAKAFAIALAPHARAPAQGGQVGLGVFIRKIDGATCFHHDGGTGGYRSSLQVIPAKGIVRVALINNDSLSGSAVIAATGPRRPAAPVTHPEISLPRAALAGYPGIYELDGDSRFTVLESEGQLWVRLTGQPFLRIFARGPDQFFYKAVDAEIKFQREGAAIQSLTLFQNGNELTAPRTAAPLPAIKLRAAGELAPYAGTYAVFGTTELTVRVKNDALFAQLAGQPAMPVFETHNDRFDYDVVEASLLFTRNAQGEINGLTLLQNGMALPAPKKQRH